MSIRSFKGHGGESLLICGKTNWWGYLGICIVTSGLVELCRSLDETACQGQVSLKVVGAVKAPLFNILSLAYESRVHLTPGAVVGHLTLCPAVDLYKHWMPGCLESLKVAVEIQRY